MAFFGFKICNIDLWLENDPPPLLFFFYKVRVLAAEEELIPIERCQNCTINTTRAYFVILLIHFKGFGNVRIGSACPIVQTQRFGVALDYKFSDQGSHLSKAMTTMR